MQKCSHENDKINMHGWMDGSMHGFMDAKVQPRKRQNQHFVVVNSGGLEGESNGSLVFVAALSMLRKPFGKGQRNRF